VIEPVVSLRDVVVDFSDRRLFGGRRAPVRAVDEVSLEVVKGEVLCIAGESGSGKTTLARAIMGLVSPTSGAIAIDGRPLRGLSRADAKEMRRRVQMVFQDPIGSLNPRHSVYEAVAEPVRIHGSTGDERELVTAALSRAGLRPPERFFLDYPHELSGGQRQRVVIAAAIALGPEVIVADEPVSMLDASVRGEILRTLAELKDELGLTLVLITHDLGIAWAVADRVAVMYLGKIVELGTTEQVLTAPLHPYTKALLEVAPRIGEVGGAAVLPGEPPDASAIPPGCRFHPRCPAVAAGIVNDGPCRAEVPDLREIGMRQRAACHHAERLESARAPR
jgi:oligopeptide/dipeptide ABC transporter ATP-binding protein